MNTVKIDKKNVLMIAHRGLSGIETENTECAFVAAGNRSYYGIETDVHLTKDGKYVVHHDENLQRVFGVNALIKDMTFDEIRKIQRSENGEKAAYSVVPTLKEYLDTCKKYEKKSVLELKIEYDEKRLQEIIAEVEKAGQTDDIIYISFYASDIEKMRKLLPTARLQFLCGEINDRTIDFCVKNGTDIDVGYPALTKETVAKLKSAGVKINCWTVNDKALAENLVSLGVDYITTNILE